ncbi:MAG: type I-C CRISPR-associated protein Cas8c/Csd1 [Thermodesulfobacteriota bacterium]
MILRSLYEYYQRAASDPDRPVAPEGFEWKEIPFVVVLTREGKFRALEDTREGDGRNRRAKKFLVPQGEKRTVGIKANLLWDNVEYALGANPRQRDDVARRHEDFKRRLRDDLGHVANLPQIQALKTFLDNNPAQQIEQHAECTESWKEVLERNLNVIFRIEGTNETSICDAIRLFLASNESKRDPGVVGLCLLTGEKWRLSRLHAPIKGVQGTSTAGGALVSFNLPAFLSFGKTQNYNAPISERAAFAYTTGLNMLLGRVSSNKTRIGDATVVFWAERRAKQAEFDLEERFASFFADPPRDDPDRGVLAVKALYEAMYSGAIPVDEGNRFYVLGLAPNAARVSVRFWKTGTIRQFADKIKKHFDDMEIVRSPKDREYLTLNQILRATALDYKTDNVPPNLAGTVVESILDGMPYPITLLHQCIRRVRAEHRVTRIRAAILKGYINRISRYNIPYGKEEITMSLDRTNTSLGYRLGRLFAVLEKIQEEANPGINATIRDRFYGAASSSPVAVFPQLLKLKNHHLSKLTNLGRKVNFEKELGEIFCGLQDFPPHLQMEDQARFAIGYYHQRQSFFNG